MRASGWPRRRRPISRTARACASAAMNLILDIAWTHVRSRVRQTGFAVAGVATGVGFSIMMASLMQGSQNDFTAAPGQCTAAHHGVGRAAQAAAAAAEQLFASAEIHGLTPEARRRGIKNPLATMAALEAWVPGGVAPSVKVQAIIRYANRDVGHDGDRASIRGARRACRSCPSRCAAPRSTRSIAPPTPSFSATGWRRRSAPASAPTSPCRPAKARASARRWSGFFHSGVRQIDEGTAYVLIKTGQILAQQTGLINELRVRLRDPDDRARDRRAHRARHRLQVGRLARGARGPA